MLRKTFVSKLFVQTSVGAADLSKQGSTVLHLSGLPEVISTQETKSCDSFFDLLTIFSFLTCFNNSRKGSKLTSRFVLSKLLCSFENFYDPCPRLTKLHYQMCPEE